VKTNNSSFLNALDMKLQKTIPIWMMRQAGRYQASYQAIRRSHTFEEILHNPAVAAEVTLNPIREFGFDAAIIFSDILMVAEALGQQLTYIEGKGPLLAPALMAEPSWQFQPQDFQVESLNCVYDAIRQAKLGLGETPLIGFCGGPFTVACYMLQGHSGLDMRKIRSWIREFPEKFEQLLDVITEASILHMVAQVKAGADLLQLFESSAGQMSAYEFSLYGAPYLKKIIDAVRAQTSVKIALFCLGIGHVRNQVLALSPDVVGVDWMQDIGGFSHDLPSNFVIQGNLDPLDLFLPVEKLGLSVSRILDCVGKRPGFIFNLGHGVLPGTPESHVKAVVESVHAYK